MMIGSSMSSTAALYVFYQLIWYPKKYSKTWESFAFLIKNKKVFWKNQNTFFISQLNSQFSQEHIFLLQEFFLLTISQH
jgi:hypothetical protein